MKEKILVIAVLILSIGSISYAALDDSLSVNMKRSYTEDSNGNVAQRVKVTGTAYLGDTVINGDLSVSKSLTATDIWLQDGTQITAGGSSYKLDASDGSPTNVVYVDGTGNVGIGTTTPTEKLDVTGNAKVTGSLTVTDVIFAQNGISFAGQDATIAANSMRISAPLSVDDEVFVGTAGSAVRDNAGTLQYRNGTGAYTNLGGASQWVDSGSDIYFSAGNVGIRATNPSAILELTASKTMTSAPVFRARNLTGSDAIFVKSNGFVGVGTTLPTSRLTIDGDIRFKTSGNTIGFDSGDYLAFWDNSTYWYTQGQNWLTYTGANRNLLIGDSASAAQVTKFINGSATRPIMQVTNIDAKVDKDLSANGGLTASGGYAALNRAKGDADQSYLMLQSPNGTKYYLRVDDSGVETWSATKP